MNFYYQSNGLKTTRRMKRFSFWTQKKKRLGEALWANQKSPGMEIGRNLNFNDCVSLLCRKAGRKLAMLARLSKFMSKQKQIFMKTFTES